MSDQCTKKPYATRYEARMALLIFFKQKRPERASYYCTECKAWHLTSKKRRVP
jgi:hypothetical protein